MLAPRGRGRDNAAALMLGARDEAARGRAGSASSAGGGGGGRRGSASSSTSAGPGGGGGVSGLAALSANDELALSLGQSRVQLGLNMAATAVHKVIT